MEPSQLGSKKGLIGTKVHKVYTGSAPCGEGKSLRSSFEWHYVCLDNQGANPLDLALDLMLLALNRRVYITFIVRKE